ncbi:MAG TPA: hypothetical protein VGG03_02300 [Thermoanaerobaculia bacterium]
MEHPSPVDLETLVFGGISAERARAVVAHLLRGCEACSLKLGQHLSLLSGRGESFGTPPPPSEKVYDAVLDRAFASAGQRGRALPPRQTPEQKKRHALDLLASGGLEGLLKAPRHLQGRPTCEALLERSWALRHEDPDEMLRFARCAAILADHLNGRGLSSQEVADFRCRAWVELGNAYRVTDELDLAEEALNRATELFLLGTGDEILGARLFTALASQFGARRSFAPALTLLGIVADIHHRYGDEHLAGRALVKKGIYTGYQGDAEEAVHLIRQGLSAADERRDPRLVFSALQSLAWFLVDCGRFREARFALWNLRQRKLDMGGRVNELKVRWLEGHIFVGLEQLDFAERALRQVKQGFEEAGLTYKAALAGLELGAVWLRQGYLKEAERVVLESTDVFVCLRIQREVLASVLLLRKAARRRRLTLGLLNAVIQSLHQAERDPHPQPPAEP